MMWSAWLLSLWGIVLYTWIDGRQFIVVDPFPVAETRACFAFKLSEANTGAIILQRGQEPFKRLLRRTDAGQLVALEALDILGGDLVIVCDCDEYHLVVGGGEPPEDACRQNNS